MATFVYDRTLDDVKALNAKGTYNATDLNRVQSACDEIAAELNAAGIPITLTWSRSTWSVAIIPTAAEMQNYLTNIGKIKAAIPNNSPAPPAAMSYLTYEGANNIERMLYEVEQLIHNMVAIFVRCGVWHCGAVYYLPEEDDEMPEGYAYLADENNNMLTDGWGLYLITEDGT